MCGSAIIPAALLEPGIHPQAHLYLAADMLTTSSDTDYFPFTLLTVDLQLANILDA
jgi:hypothetical protein